MKELPKGWEWSTVGELGDYINGRGFKKSEWSESGRPIIRIQNLTGSGSGFNHFAGDLEDRYVVPTGALLVSWAATLGVYRWDGPEGALNQHIFRVRSFINEDFHRYLLEHALDLMQGDTHGSGMVHITRGRFDATPAPLPPPAEQERIVAAIEEAFSKLDAGEAGLRTVRQLLKRMRDAILAAAVTGRLVPQDPTDTPAPKLLADLGIEPLDSERGDIPDGWASLGLENALAHTIGGVWGAEHGADEIDVAVLRVTEMRADGSLDPSSAVVRSITARQLETRRLELGDLLLEKSGGGPTRPVGRVGLVRQVADPSVCANFMQLLRPDRRLCVPEYLEIALRQLHSSGGTEPLQTASTNIRNLKMKDYFSLPVLLPPISEQARIVTELERQMSFVDACERAVNAGLERSAALRRSVLRAAFEGRLVPQDPTDEPASVLLERIRAERAAAPKAKTRRAKAKS